MNPKKTRTTQTDRQNELRSILAKLNNQNKKAVLEHARRLLTLQRGGMWIIKN